MENIILTFKDQQYPLAKVIAKAKAGPRAEAKIAEINLSDEARGLVKLSSDSFDLHNGPLIFYKHEGKYIVLSGMAAVERGISAKAGVIGGRLLTHFALKSVRIEKPIAESVKVQAVEQLADKFSSPRPGPRTYDSKTPRSAYGSNHRSGPRQASGNTLHARSGGNRSGS